jgi:hypothetical protein
VRRRTVTGNRFPRKYACGFQIPRDPEVRYVVDFGVFDFPDGSIDAEGGADSAASCRNRIIMTVPKRSIGIAATDRAHPIPGPHEAEKVGHPVAGHILVMRYVTEPKKEVHGPVVTTAEG